MTRVCPSASLADGRTGVRFEIQSPGGVDSAFAIRFQGKVRAYVNRCPHQGTELDWQPGEFFDITGTYIVCATHGALFEPDSGLCIAGPCRGARLAVVAVAESDGEIVIEPTRT